MCACNGVEPANALARSRGGYRCKVNSIKKASEKKKKSSNKDTKKKHFHKVGKICESTVIQRKNKKRKCVDEDILTIDDKEIDPDYVENVSATATFTSTIQTESINMNPKASKRKRVTKTTKTTNTTKTPTATTNIEKNDMETITEVDDELDFENQIESTNDISIFEDDEVATTIAKQIMRSHKQLPPKEHRFVVTNMEEVNKEVHCDDAKDIMAISSKESCGRLLSLGNRMLSSCMK